MSVTELIVVIFTCGLYCST